ncbi:MULTISPECIES: phospholipase D family protein [Mycobacterium avium complex (MAC)]|uniref:phospholipase D family protein n=1 Tax=Mycobacterium avium complex (MAC) TaxID=120793 RepID=UPI000AE4657D|nr:MULTISPECIES: phospholipase D family protein [Mycobacterium avium complex (MAC)]MBZ4611369.1 hypothetical protein [Mycobacterium avium subsp. hominissuis]
MAEVGDELLKLAGSARREFVMCAPFAKQAAVQRVMSAIPDGVHITLYTRWRPEEVAAGVSDTQVLPTVRSRGGAVYLHDRLHAKFYRTESQALLGSANLTAAALGWSLHSNIELLVRSRIDQIADVERFLSEESTEANDDVAREVDEIAKQLPAPTLDLAEDIEEPAGIVDLWVPQLRMPSDLYSAYSKGFASLSSRSAAAAAVDLAVLDLPVGLDKRQFEVLVGHRLRNQPLIQSIDQHLNRPRRFGEVREKLSQLTGYDRAQADDAWQTVMRWMMEFLPDRYTRDVHRHSEIMSRKTVTE